MSNRAVNPLPVQAGLLPLIHPMCFSLVFPIFLTEYISSSEYFVRKFLQIFSFFYATFICNLPVPDKIKLWSTEELFFEGSAHAHSLAPSPLLQGAEICMYHEQQQKKKQTTTLVTTKHYHFGCAGEREEAPSNWDYRWYYCTN